MRLLILFESLLVVALAVAILTQKRTVAASTDVFRADRLILDAKPGEAADFRGDDGVVLAHKLMGSKSGGGPLGGSPLHYILTSQRGPTGEIPGTAVQYEHDVARHGLFPCLTPAHPDADDRLWIWRRLRRETIAFRGERLSAWRMDCIDPALPPGQEAVVVWFHEDAPLFGIVRFARNGRTYDLLDWRAP
jgi:hypothetical protein